MNNVYTRFEQADIISGVKSTKTDIIWSNGSGSLTAFYTSSVQSASNGNYYYNVYASNPQTDTSAVANFAIAYAHYAGSGSQVVNSAGGDNSLTPSKAIYSQYQNFLLPSSQTIFRLNSVAMNQFVAINFNRSRFKESLDPGNIEISLRNSAGSATYKLIDDSTVSAGLTDVGGTYYNIVSGSLTNGVYNTSSPTYIGLVYPKYGVVLLDADKLASSFSITITSASNAGGSNHQTVLGSISAAAAADATNDGFKVRNSETVQSSYYFVRVKNGDYNFSTNPSFYSGSAGQLRFTEMLYDPQTFITAIGLYNDDNELLAVAKVSKAVKKNFNREALFRVMLQF